MTRRQEILRDQDTLWRVKDVAERLNVSYQTAIRWMEGEPDVKIIIRSTPGKRSYRILLIPESTVRRFLDSGSHALRDPALKKVLATRGPGGVVLLRDLN